MTLALLRVRDQVSDRYARPKSDPLLGAALRYRATIARVLMWDRLSTSDQEQEVVA